MHNYLAKWLTLPWCSHDNSNSEAGPEANGSCEQALIPPNDSDSDSGAGSSHEQAPVPVPIAGPMMDDYGGDQVMYNGRAASAEPLHTYAPTQPTQAVHLFTITCRAQNPYSSSKELFEKEVSYSVVGDHRLDEVEVRVTRTWQMPGDRNSNPLESSNTTQIVETVYVGRVEFEQAIRILSYL